MKKEDLAPGKVVGFDVADPITLLGRHNSPARRRDVSYERKITLVRKSEVSRFRKETHGVKLSQNLKGLALRS